MGVSALKKGRLHRFLPRRTRIIRSGWPSAEGRRPPTVFVRNAMCPLTSDQLDARSSTLLATMLRPEVRVGTSTPKADPSGDYDVFLTYCTNAVAAQKEVARLKVVEIPPELQVGAAYGLTARSDAPLAVSVFAQSLLAPPAQALFKRFGLGPP